MALICLVAFAASMLTFFSGFGLGTVLMPAFAVFFPIELAVALTAIVHFANNLFKLGLVGRAADRALVLRFGLPAVAGAWLGARTLSALSTLAPLARYELLGAERAVAPVKLVAAAVMLGFAYYELRPRPKDADPPGGAALAGAGLLSGFFGGLSGHQGALRSAALARLALSPERFIATGVAIACLVDLTRLGVYARHWPAARDQAALLAAACLAAFAGALFGKKLAGKTTIEGIRRLVAAMLILFALALAAGLL